MLKVISLCLWISSLSSAAIIPLETISEDSPPAISVTRTVSTIHMEGYREVHSDSSVAVQVIDRSETDLTANVRCGFWKRHSNTIVWSSVLTASCVLTWGITTLVENPITHAPKLSSECLGILGEGIYYIKNAVFKVDGVNAMAEYVCGFASDMVCCDSRHAPVVYAPDIESEILIMAGTYWDCSRVGETWARFSGYLFD